jgi:hypothetical protein
MLVIDIRHLITPIYTPSNHFCGSTGILTKVCGIGTPFSSRRSPSCSSCFSCFGFGANGLSSSASSLGWGIFAAALCQCQACNATQDKILQEAIAIALRTLCQFDKTAATAI